MVGVYGSFTILAEFKWLTNVLRCKRQTSNWSQNGFLIGKLQYFGLWYWKSNLSNSLNHLKHMLSASLAAYIFFPSSHFLLLHIIILHLKKTILWKIEINEIDFISGLGRELAIQMGELNSIVVCLDVDDEANEKTAELVKAGGGIAFAWVNVCFFSLITIENELN